MFTPIGLMLLGMALGFGLRRVACLERVSRAITPTILLMLFVLGVAVGGNKTLMGNLPTLGGRALALTLAGVAGSMVGVVLIRRFFPGAQAGRHARPGAGGGEPAGSPEHAAAAGMSFAETTLPPLKASGASDASEASGPIGPRGAEREGADHGR